MRAGGPPRPACGVLRRCRPRQLRGRPRRRADAPAGRARAAGNRSGGWRSGRAAGAGAAQHERAGEGHGDDERARDGDRHGALSGSIPAPTEQGRRDGIAAMHCSVRTDVASYQDLLAEVRTQINESGAADAAARLSSDEPPVLVDVREADEFDQGAIDGAMPVSRGLPESRIGRSCPISRRRSSSAASRARSAFAARSLESSATRTSARSSAVSAAGSRTASRGARRAC